MLSAEDLARTLPSALRLSSSRRYVLVLPGSFPCREKTYAEALYQSLSFHSPNEDALCAEPVNGKDTGIACVSTFDRL